MNIQAKSQLNFDALFLFVAILFVAFAARCADTNSVPSRTIESTNDWKLIWSDEFNGPAGAGVDVNKWTTETGGNGNGNREWEFYTTSRSNAVLDGHGCLDIIALKSPTNTFHTRFGDGSYSSARFNTRKKFSVKYGRIEARIKIPAGHGMWPAFWMMGDDIGTAGWPAGGEIDIMENIGKEPGTVHGTMHGPGYSGSQGPSGLFRLKNQERFADQFHVFSVEWETNEIRWYMDGQFYERRTPADLPAGKKWVYDHPFFLLLNLAIGGGWPGYPDETTKFPAVMAVDYVRVYQR
jgi:beta-glucanase (GH16 family)